MAEQPQAINRKVQEVRLGDQVFRVQELLTEDILEILGKQDAMNKQRKEVGQVAGQEAQHREAMMAEFISLIPKAIDGGDFDKLKKYSLSQLKALYDAFKEVNELFFLGLEHLGIIDALKQMLAEVRKELTTQLLVDLQDLWPMATPTPSGTGGGSSVPASENSNG